MWSDVDECRQLWQLDGLYLLLSAFKLRKHNEFYFQETILTTIEPLSLYYQMFRHLDFFYFKLYQATPQDFPHAKMIEVILHTSNEVIPIVDINCNSIFWVCLYRYLNRWKEGQTSSQRVWLGVFGCLIFWNKSTVPLSSCFDILIVVFNERLLLCIWDSIVSQTVNKESTAEYK